MPGFVCWVLGIVFWVLGFVFWVLGLVFWVLGLVFWVSGFVFWVLGYIQAVMKSAASVAPPKAWDLQGSTQTPVVRMPSRRLGPPLQMPNHWRG